MGSNVNQMPNKENPPRGIPEPPPEFTPGKPPEQVHTEQNIVQPTRAGAGTSIDNWISDQATVQNQVMGLLGEDNDLMKYAESQGREAANTKGWTNSDMQETAGKRAMYESVVMPMAQQDAAAYTQSDLKGQEIAGALDTLDTRGQWDLAQKEAEYGYQADAAEFAANVDFAKMGTEYGYQGILNEWQNRLDVRLAEIGYDNSDRQVMAQLTAGLYSDMIDYSSGVVNNNDLEVTDGVIDWGGQFLNEFIDFDFGF